MMVLGAIGIVRVLLLMAPRLDPSLVVERCGWNAWCGK
jgi:hypothetical protein